MISILRKNIRSTYILLILLFPTVSIVNAQELKNNFDEVYNMDPELYNGAVFTGVYRGHIDGTQFFVSADFYTGDLGLQTHVYKEQKLNLDVYDQKVLLSFKNDINAVKIIELPLANIKYFYLDSKYFEVLPWQDDNYRIFQVFGDDNMKIIIHWSRTLNAGTGSRNNRSNFSNLKKLIWIYKEESYFPIKNNKTLIKLYSLDQQTKIKKWLKENRLKLQKTDDEGIQLIIDYIQEL